MKPDVDSAQTMDLPFQPPLAPMEAKHVPSLPRGDDWQFEPKWDGFRAICFKAGDDVSISSRKELPFNRYFPEIVEAVRTLACDRCVLDGEIVVFTSDGLALNFDALLQRIHPAESRVRRLARETPDAGLRRMEDRKSTRLNSSHVSISYAVFCLKKKKNT